MSALRLVMVTPRYWPLVGETERFVATLAGELRSRVAELTILTACWAGEWPREVVHRETPTVRLPHAPRGGWSTFRYLQSMARWLRVQRAALDLVYVMSLRHDAYAALSALRGRQVAVVLRPRVGDSHWFQGIRWRGRVRRRFAEADALVAPTNSLVAELQNAGYPASRIHRIPNGVQVAEPRTSASRYQARQVLAEANADLAAAEYAPIAVCVGRFHEGQRLSCVIQAWRPIATRWPQARLWLVGDGPLREALYQRLVDQGVHHHVFMPGTFDDLADLLAAADVFVTAATATDGGQFLLEAMAAGLPVVATDTPDHRDVIQQNVHGKLVPPENREALTGAIKSLFESPQLAARYGEAGRNLVQLEYSSAAMAAEHLQLFERVVGEKRRGGT